jgi:GH25 family lysozyme M1 (1,4-beta-N-acetylmuramidase)
VSLSVPAAPQPSRRLRGRRLLGPIAIALLLVAAVVPGAVAAPARRSAADTAPGQALGAGSGVTGDATAATSTLEGIDVSHWQGAINWASVAGAGKKFAIIKATESTNYVDPNYATNHAQAKAAGLWTGAYHFAQPSSTANDAVLEADYFAAHLNLGAGDLIPALDLEASGGLSISALQSWVMAFVNEVTAKVGSRPMIYTSPAFWKKYMGDTTALADAGYKTLWIAHWNVTSPAVPASNWGGHGWTFWQYSDCGHVSGIANCVDLDRYNGTDLTPVAYSIFKLAASIPTGAVKQGTSSSANVSILRTNFTSEVALTVTGLPAGTTAAFDANPTTDTAAVVTVTTPADPSATPVGTYPLTIAGVGDGITRTTKVNLVIADGIPPTLTMPMTHLWSGRTLGTTTVPVRVSWSATDPSGVASTALQYSIDGGPWVTTPLPGATAMAVDTTIPIGGNASQQVRATDTKANVSDWLAAGPVSASVYQQSSSAVTWTGTWHTTGWSGASGGSVRYATTKGASATFHFTGSSVGWVAATGPTRGGAWVYVDGVFAASISLRASTGHSRAIVFARNWTTVGSHTLRIVVAGTAGHPRVDVDAFIRLTTG